MHGQKNIKFFVLLWLGYIVCH